MVHLLLTRRIRAAVVAAGTFAGLTLLGAVIQPGSSFDYWVTGRAFNNQPMLGGSGPQYAGNQSLQGFVARQLETNELNTSWWMLSAVVVVVQSCCSKPSKNVRIRTVGGAPVTSRPKV